MVSTDFSALHVLRTSADVQLEYLSATVCSCASSTVLHSAYCTALYCTAQPNGTYLLMCCTLNLAAAYHAIDADAWVKQPDGTYLPMAMYQRVETDDGEEQWLCVRGSSLVESFHAASNELAPGSCITDRLLALMVEHRQMIWNLQRLERMGNLTAYGMRDLQMLSDINMLQTALQQPAVKGMGAEGEEAAGAAATEAGSESHKAAAGRQAVQNAGSTGSEQVAEGPSSAGIQQPAAKRSAKDALLAQSTITPSYTRVMDPATCPLNPFAADEAHHFKWDPLGALRTAEHSDRSRRQAGEVRAAALQAAGINAKHVQPMDGAGQCSVQAPSVMKDAPTAWLLLRPGPGVAQPTAVPPDRDYIHETFLSVLAEAESEVREEQEEEARQQAEAADATISAAADALVQLQHGPRHAQPSSSAAARPVSKQAAPSAAVSKAVKARPKVSLAIEPHGSSRVASKWVKNTGGIPRIELPVDRPVHTKAEKELFRQWLPKCQRRGGRVDYKPMRAEFNRRFMEQGGSSSSTCSFSGGEEGDEQKFIWGKRTRDLRQYHLQQDRKRRERENKAFNRVMNTRLAAPALQGQTTISTFLQASKPKAQVAAPSTGPASAPGSPAAKKQKLGVAPAITASLVAHAVDRAMHQQQASTSSQWEQPAPNAVQPGTKPMQPAPDAMQQAAGAAATQPQQGSRDPYMCKDCLLCQGYVVIKKEHKCTCKGQGNEAAAKAAMRRPASQSFDAKAYIRWQLGQLSGAPKLPSDQAKQLRFSKGAYDMLKDQMDLSAYKPV